MRLGKSSTEKQKYHCETCGEDWESTVYEDERGDGMVGWIPDHPHECKLYHGTFFLREDLEYKYKEGVLYRRKVIYLQYSGHDTIGLPKNMVGEWEERNIGLRDSENKRISKY